MTDVERDALEELFNDWLTLVSVDINEDEDVTRIYKRVRDILETPKQKGYKVKYTDENVMAIAQKIVDGMDLKELMTYVYGDLCELMDKDEEAFNDWVDHFECNN